MRKIQCHKGMTNWERNTHFPWHSFPQCYGFLQILAVSCDATFRNKALFLRSTFHNLSSRGLKIRLVRWIVCRCGHGRGLTNQPATMRFCHSSVLSLVHYWKEATECFPTGWNRLLAPHISMYGAYWKSKYKAEGLLSQGQCWKTAYHFV